MLQVEGFDASGAEAAVHKTAVSDSTPAYRSFNSLQPRQVEALDASRAEATSLPESTDLFASKSVQSWSVEETAQFIRQFSSLQKYCPSLIEDEVTGAMLVDLCETEGLSELGITLKVHQDQDRAAKALLCRPRGLHGSDTRHVQNDRHRANP